MQHWTEKSLPQDAYTPAKDDTMEKWIQEGGAAKTENHKRDYIWELEAEEGISEMGLLELKPKLKKMKKSPDEERRENPRQRKQELTYRGPESRNTWPVP